MKNFDMELILSIFGYLLCLLAGVFWVGPGTISPVFLALSAFLLVVVYVSVHPIGRKMRRLLARMFTKEDDEIAVTKQHKAIFRLLMLLVVMFTSFVTTSQAQSLLIDVSVNNY